MIIKKQRHFILLSILLIAALFLCSGQAFAAENEIYDANAYELRFIQTAKTASGGCVYELQIRQTVKADTKELIYGVSMATLYFTADTPVEAAISKDGAPLDFKCSYNGNTFQLKDLTPGQEVGMTWTAPADGFTYLCTIVTEQPATFDWDPTKASGITNNQCPNAEVTLVSPGLIGEITASDSDSVDLEVIAPADGRIIAAAYNAQGRMIAPIVVEEATIPVLPADWDMTTRAEAAVTELTLDCDTSELAEVRVFLVSDLAVLKPLTPHLILEYANN